MKQLTLADNEILVIDRSIADKEGNEISKTYATKAELSTNYATKAELETLDNSIKEDYVTFSEARQAFDKLNEEKQDKLQAGANIKIEGNVISAAGGAGGFGLNCQYLVLFAKIGFIVLPVMAINMSSFSFVLVPTSEAPEGAFALYASIPSTAKELQESKIERTNIRIGKFTKDQIDFENPVFDITNAIKSGVYTVEQIEVDGTVRDITKDINLELSPVLDVKFG